MALPSFHFFLSFISLFLSDSARFLFCILNSLFNWGMLRPHILRSTENIQCYAAIMEPFFSVAQFFLFLISQMHGQLNLIRNFVVEWGTEII